MESRPILSAPHPPRRLVWSISLGVWLLAGLVEALRTPTANVVTATGVVERVTFPWTSLLLLELVPKLAWAALTPVIFEAAWRLPLRPGQRVRTLPLLVVLGLAVALVHPLLTGFVTFHPSRGIAFLPPPKAFTWPFRSESMGRLLPGGFLVYGVILGAGYAVELAWRYRQQEQERLRLATRAGTLEAQLAQAALASLRAQLQPHFLFNTLNAISTLLGERPVEARRALAELAELLRETLTRGETVETTLEEELDWIERYLELQSLRYGDRLRVEIEVTPGVLAALVPTMLLQPLVENALQHGITARRGTGRLRIAADRSGQALRLVVEDDGPGPVLEEERREGVGLSNTRRRLHVLYGEAGRLELCPAEGGGTASVVELPFHTGPPRPASVPTWAETSAAA